MNRSKELLWGLPSSPIVANLFMEDLDNKSPWPQCHPPLKSGKGLWMTLLLSSRKQTKMPSLITSTQLILASTLHMKIPKEDGSIPFLNMLITSDEEGRLNTNVYRKPTHTDQYLHWDSHHAIASKYSVIGTLYHRARTVCSNPNQLQNEEKHLFKLSKCK